jgi:hypothetical protein
MRRERMGHDGWGVLECERESAEKERERERERESRGQ